MKKKLILLSGPSCVGKGPLKKALADLHPEIIFAEPVWCHSRKPRFKKSEQRWEVHGVDYYFLPRSTIEALDREKFIVAPLRSDVQALDMGHVEELFGAYDMVMSEIFHTFMEPLHEWAEKQEKLEFEITTVSLIPMSWEELTDKTVALGKSEEQVVHETMKAKLERRGEDPPGKMEERARSAYREMKIARGSDRVIVCRAGEDDTTEWGRPPGPEAERVLGEFVDVLTS